MDFCNFSRECDLYCFEQVGGGYVTLVAKNRPKFDRIAELEVESEAEFTEAVNKQIKSLMKHKVTAREIGLPADGQEFLDPDLPALLNVGLVFWAGPLAAFFARRTEVNLLVPRDRVEDTYRKTFRLSGIVNLIGVGLVALILMRNEIW